MKKSFLIISIFLFAVCAFGQKKYELGNVTIDELKEKAHPNDTTAVAAILFKKGKTYFDLDFLNWTITTEVELKIKIYKKEGYVFADQQIQYYSGGNQVEVDYDNVATYNLVGDKIEKTKLKKDGKFTEEVNGSYSNKKITLPKVKEGSIIEYKYTIKTPNFITFDDWYFQYPIPANHVEYLVAMPDFFSYNTYIKGNLTIDKTIPDIPARKGKSFSEKRRLYSVDNVKAFKAEAYVNNIENYIPTLQMVLASANISQGVVKSYSTDWASVAKNIYDAESFGGEIKSTSYFQKDLDLLLQNVTSNDMKVNMIFNYVQAKMNWDRTNGYFSHVGVSKAYAEKVGNVAEINLMLIAMLRYAGIETNPVLVSTRSNGIALFPNPSAYNYVIAAVELVNDQLLLLDATTKSAVPNILPVEALNWKGRMIRKDGTSIEVDLIPKVSSKEITNVIASIETDGKIIGKTRQQYYDYNGYVFREHFLTLPKDKYLEEIEKMYKGIEIEEYSTANDIDLSKPLIENYNFTHNNIVENIGSKAYFSPMLYYARTENPFKDEEREFPIDFNYPHQDKHFFTISIPDGYEIESLPAPIALSMEENIGSFKYNISQAGRQIQLTTVFEINYSNVSPEFYGTIRDFYKKMIEKQNEKVVLKKV